ncbi:radical SAM protein [Serratia plymuthica]|uniref:radical SAM protein n=1 Tax=Serratia plymuthica TaxID=82996 RepID=UPI0009363C1C|nr:radical SAM protein [Serratia plymuthica]OJT42763.1 radical SAM protein [Serratia plymuthica]
MQGNMDMSYDYHGDIDFRVPFTSIKNEDIHFYLDVDTFVGKDTCGQNCNHCWFVNYEKVFSKSFGINEGHEIYRKLTDQNFNIYPRYVDSFAHNGEFMDIYGPAHNREFRSGEDKNETDTMIAGDAWTSGKPLLQKNYKELLDKAVKNGYGTISITFHGRVNDAEECSLHSHADYPIKGVFPGAKCIEVISRIKSYSLESGDNNLIRVNIGITVGTHNHTKNDLVNYCKLFNKLGVQTVRFNCFTDHGRRHPHLQLTQEQVAQFYQDIKWIHENIPLNFQLGVSEDFGTSGIDILGLPSHVGWCRAGRQLFAIIPEAGESLVINGIVHERIGQIVGCVNIFEPTFGYLTRFKHTDSGETDYQIHFNVDAIEAFTQERLSGVYKNGCFAGEILQMQNYDIPLVNQNRIDIIEV